MDEGDQAGGEFGLQELRGTDVLRADESLELAQGFSEAVGITQALLKEALLAELRASGVKLQRHGLDGRVQGLLVQRGLEQSAKESCVTSGLSGAEDALLGAAILEPHVQAHGSHR
jgi:hypothetical protein